MTERDEKDETVTAREPESSAVEETSSVEVVEQPSPDQPSPEQPSPDQPSPDSGRGIARVLAFGVVPALVVVLAIAVGWFAFFDIKTNRTEAAGTEAMQVAKDSTVTLLSYNPDTVEQQLTDARNLLTGEFKDSYTNLTNDVVIPGAKQQRISAVATVPRAASVSTETGKAVVLVFVNQTVVVGDTQPTATLSSVRVTLDKVDGKWLISKFDPV